MHFTTIIILKYMLIKSLIIFNIYIDSSIADSWIKSRLGLNLKCVSGQLSERLSWKHYQPICNANTNHLR